jgi:O-antigen/teichoic acid export membrane protein
MTGLVKRFLKDSSIYALDPIFTRLIIFFLLPLYTSYLSPADYGNLQYILTFGAFFTSFIDLGLFSSFWKYKSESSEYRKDEVVLNIIITIIFCGVSLLIVSILFKSVFLRNSLIGWLVIIYFISAVMRKIFDTAAILMQANFKATLYVTASAIHACLLLGVNILFVAKLRMNVSGVIYGYLTTSIIVSSVFSYIIVRNMGGRLNPRLIKEMLAYGVPIMIGNLAAVAIAMSDRFFLKAFSTDTELGLYSFGSKFGELIRVLLINSFFLAWNPLRWEIYEMANGKEIFARSYRVLLIGLPVLALVLLSGVLILVPYVTFNPEYLAGMKITAIITFSYIFHGIYYFNAMGMLFEKKTSVIMYIIIASGITNIILNYLLVPKLGMLGAAIASIGSYIQMFLLGRHFCQRYYGIMRDSFFEGAQILLIIITAAFVTSLLYSIKNVQIVGVAVFLCAFAYVAINLLIKNITVGELRIVTAKLFSH